jgi:hypothetical protein
MVAMPPHRPITVVNRLLLHRAGHATGVPVAMCSAAIIYPTVTHTNYSEWTLVMRVNLQDIGPCDAVELGTNDYREDRSALTTFVTPHVSNPHDYVNHMFKRP